MNTRIAIAATALAAIPLLTACGDKESPAPGESGSPTAQASAPAGGPAVFALPDSDACSLLDGADIAAHVGPAAGFDLSGSDALEAIQWNEDSRSCSWLWGEGHRVDLQVTGEPAGNQFDTWASRMLAERIDAQGYVAIEGIGDAAGFKSEDSELFWILGEEFVFLLSYGGPSPDAAISSDELLALAGEVG